MSLARSSILWVHDIFVFSSERKYELVERWRVEILGKFWNPEITFWKKKKFYFEIVSNLQKSCRNSTQDSYMSNQIPQVLGFCHIYLIIFIVILSFSLYICRHVCFFLNHLKVRLWDTDVQNRLLDSVGEGEGGMFRKNSMYIIYSETDHQPR